MATSHSRLGIHDVTRITVLEKRSLPTGATVLTIDVAQDGGGEVRLDFFSRNEDALRIIEVKAEGE